MVKGKYEKSIRISNKGGGKDAEESYVQGSKLTKTPKPKSLTPQPKKGR